MFGWPNNLVMEDMKFTKHYVTIDFESRMCKGMVDKVYTYTEESSCMTSIQSKCRRERRA